MIETHAGASGGYMLKKDASSISIHDMISLLEGEAYIPECIKQGANDNLYTTLSTSIRYMDILFKTVTFDQLSGIDKSGRLSEIIRIVETHINVMENESCKKYC